MKLVIDIDGVVCNNTWGKYELAKPLKDNIKKLNLLYEAGNNMVYFTARGYETGIDWRSLTEKQFDEWGIRYNELHFGKPSGDYYIDDKAFNSIEQDIEKIFGVK